MPYYNGNKCIKCVKPFILFNVETLNCEACQSGKFYDNKTYKC